MATQLNDIAIWVNNTQVAYTADSLSSSDGFGTGDLRNAVVGGGQTEDIESDDLSSKVGMVKFSMPSTAENDALKRAWKLNKANNVVELIGPPGSNFSKIFTRAKVVNDPETNYSTDGNIEIEFKSRPAQ